MLNLTTDRATSRLQPEQPTASDTPPLTPSFEKEWKPCQWNPSCLPATPPPELNTESKANGIEQSHGHPQEHLLRRSTASGLTVTSGEISQDEEPFVAVIGIGYVGTHLVESFASQYRVIGFDVSERRIEQLREEFDSQTHIEFTTRREHLVRATHFLISVPTLLRSDKSVDTSYLESALATVAAHARPGATVVIESSVAVGMTRALLGPLCASHNFYGGMSPERVDPGRTDPPMRSIPKVISGLTPTSLTAITRLYAPVFDRLVPVSRPEVAEMMKLYENCQRMMNIAFANEMADACIPHAIDPFEVADAAATKPFGYMPFTPSAGVGGHCIPVNPYYLLSNSEFPLLRAAAEKMGARPGQIARRVVEGLLPGRKGRVLVVGVGFKRGQSVLSNSPGVEVVRALKEAEGVEVAFADPLVKQSVCEGVERLGDGQWRKEVLETFDVIVVVVRQVGLDFGVLEQLEGVKVEMWAR
ncbi:hypothetical protein QBC34DRAFT_296324 [Podospora aff. communis PSN243]|uniref:Nucleotide sugar dehydrogenase n=1 Tax=Podospora aff. communis PSN243 TaxID=3040156 RepID=A0AAV9GPZ4_9PEZI|nr:hypothetical protein QBC34DRAFT_296324 [Podospora aff. communis PSN243]